jgi:hypothetical protein
MTRSLVRANGLPKPGQLAPLLCPSLTVWNDIPLFTFIFNIFFQERQSPSAHL